MQYSIVPRLNFPSCNLCHQGKPPSYKSTSLSEAKSVFVALKARKKKRPTNPTSLGLCKQQITPETLADISLPKGADRIWYFRLRKHTGGTQTQGKSVVVYSGRLERRTIERLSDRDEEMKLYSWCPKTRIENCVAMLLV